MTKIFNFISSLLISSVLASIFVSRLHAQSAGELMVRVEPSELANAFIGQCILNEGNIVRISEIAKALKFVELETGAMSAFGALDASADQIGWLVTSGDGAPYLLGINSGEIDGKKYDICTVTNPFLNATAAINAWQSLAGTLKLVSDKTRFGQRERVWKVTDWIEGALVFSVEGTRKIKGGITLSLVMPQSK